MTTRALFAFALLALVTLVLACSSDATPPPAADQVVLAPNTKIADDATRQALAAMDADGTLHFSHGTPLTDGLAQGDIFDSAMAPPAAPAGFLRRVVSVDRSGPGPVVKTSFVSIAEAIKHGSVSQQRPLQQTDVTSFQAMDPSVSLMPQSARGGLRPQNIPAGHGMTLNVNNFTLSVSKDLGNGVSVMGSVTLNGHVTFDPTLHFDLDINNFTVQHFLASVDFPVDSDLTVTGTLGLEVDESKDVATIEFAPIDVQVGPFAIVLVPYVGISVGVKGTISISVSFHEVESLSDTIGASYDNSTGQWTNLTYATGTGQIDNAPQVQGSLDVQAYAKALASVAFFGVIDLGLAPYVQLGAEINMATPRHPFLQLGMHVTLGAVLHAEIVGLNLGEHDIPAFDQFLPFFSSPNTPPFVAITSPGNGTSFSPQDSVHFQAAVFDLEDGIDDETHVHVTWTSDLDGFLGKGSDFQHVFSPTMPGPRTITVTAVDSDHAQNQAQQMITFDNPGPVVSIASPSAGGTIYVGDNVQLQGAVADGFFPPTGVDLCTNGFTYTWTSSLGDTITPGSACLAATVTFADTRARDLLLHVTDPWQVTNAASVHVVPIARPPNTFMVQITGVAGSYSSTSGGLLTPPITLHAATAQPGALTYTWSAYGYYSNGQPETAPIAVGTGNDLSWQPVNTAGVVDMALAGGVINGVAGQKLHVQVHVVDASNNTGDAGWDFMFVIIPG
jgi:hypothetical protein